MIVSDLESLRIAMVEGDPEVLDEHGQWSADLPTFGGDWPEDTLGVWSWDRDRLLVGTCADDLEIVERETECAYCQRTQYGEKVVPAVDDERAWEEEASYHASDCEWLIGRAGRIAARDGAALTRLTGHDAIDYAMALDVPLGSGQAIEEAIDLVAARPESVWIDGDPREVWVGDRYAVWAQHSVSAGRHALLHPTDLVSNDYEYFASARDAYEHATAMIARGESSSYYRTMQRDAGGYCDAE